MIIIPYEVKHQQSYRTRIRFQALNGCDGLCAAVRQKLAGVFGVVRVQVRSRSGSVILIHPDAQIDLTAICDIVSRTIIDLGQVPGITYDRPDSSACCVHNSDTKSNSLKSHISGPSLFFSGLYILFLFGKYFLTTITTPTSLAARLFSVPALVAFSLSLPIQRQAVENLKRTGKPDMGLISSGLLYLAIFTGNVLPAVMVFWLFNLSSWLEDRIRNRTRQAIREMLTGRVNTVWLVKEDIEIEVAVDSIQPGDTISLRSCSTIPVDGTVLQGKALLNESTLTGESLSVFKQRGDEVLAGTILESGQIMVQVDRSGEETRLEAIIRLIETAESDPGELQLTSQRLSQAMFPFSLGLAAAAFLVTGNLLQAMAVLIITCPCALRLSTSVIVSSAMSISAGEGILIKGGSYVEIAGRVNVVVLDKTGTLTATTSEVTTIRVLDKRFKPETILQLAASVQQTWPHPLSRAVVSKAKEEGVLLLPCDQNHLVTGQGVQARIKNKEILVGSLRFMEEHDVSCSCIAKMVGRAAEVSKAGELYVAAGGRLIGQLETRSRIREDVEQALQKIRAMGVKCIVLLTGDSEAGTVGLQKKFGFDKVCWSQSPEDKASWIKDWKTANPKDVVAMVGDGINDTPAFAAADLSLAIGKGGADVAVEYADIVLQPGTTSQVAEIIELGQRALGTIKECYGLAIGLNAATLAMTTLSIISPVSGALLHNLITVAVVTNAGKIRSKANRGKKWRVV